MRTRRVLAAIAVLSLVAVACRSTSGPTTRGDVTTGVGVTADGTILLGELSPLTGPVAVIGLPLTKGHEVYFEYVNTELGGVGRNLPEDERFKVELRTLDTMYVTQTHKQQYAALKDDVLLIAQSLGTPTTQAILSDVREDMILTGAATLASIWLKEKYVVPAGAPYPVQVINAFDYIVNTLGEEVKAGIIYQDDDYGAEGLAGIEFAAERLDFDIVARESFKSGDTEFGTQVAAMQREGATHVFVTSTPGATGAILGTAAALKYAPQWIGQSPSWIGALAQSEALLPYLQANFWVVADAACNWGETGPGCEGMEEMVANLEKYGGDQGPDYYFQFGYTQARIIHQILERAIELGQLTREGVVEAFESLNDVDMGGLLNPISYGPTCEEKIPATGSTIYSIDPAEPIALKAEATVEASFVREFPFCA